MNNRHISFSTEQLAEARRRDEENAKVSNCCGEVDRLSDINGPDWSTLGMCPRCKEHCEFVDIDDEQDT